MTSGFTRRSILKSIVVVSAATAGSSLLGACGGDDDGNGLGSGGSALEGVQFFPQSVASGDPRQNSVVLWTRVVDGTGDRTLVLQVSTTQDFAQLVAEQTSLGALAANDGCIKVKVTGLQPRTDYYYRFLYEKEGTRYASRTGRTRTAPAATDDAPVRFALVNCQDFTGRYYNAHQRLRQLDADLDFVLFVGDYVYETAGDPSFQDTTSSRRVVFTDQAGAIRLGTAERPFFAAKSVSNYRELYSTYRSDAQLQAVHERYPMIVMWDDHEFSDDSHGATGTYTDGRVNETDTDRRRNAEQAFFEYMPVDDEAAGEGVLQTPREALYPQTKLWRDFTFGKNLDLVVTDYRTYRPDHLVPEDAFPGTVVMDEPTLNAISTTIVPSLPAALFAYVEFADLSAQQQGTLQAVATGAYRQAGLSVEAATARATAALQGKLAVQYLNGLIAQAGPAAEPLLIPSAGKPRGIAYVHFAKLDVFTDIGSRYFATKTFYDLYASYRYAATAGKSEDVWGAEQQAWFYSHLGRRGATWRAVVSSVSLTTMPLKLSTKTDITDPLLRQDFNFNVDQWDGFPNKRRELLGVMATQSVHNTLFLSGDIHASFLSTFGGAASNRAITAPAISSAPIRELIRASVANTPPSLNTKEGSPFYKYVVTELDQTLREGNADLLFTDTQQHGFVVVDVEAGSAKATFHLIPQAEAAVDYAGRAGELPGKFTTQEFTVASTRQA
jgi:alkaline phosphatase D